MSPVDFPRFFFFFQAEDGIRDKLVTGVQTCALPICEASAVCPSRLLPQPRGARLPARWQQRDQRTKASRDVHPLLRGAARGFLGPGQAVLFGAQHGERPSLASSMKRGKRRNGKKAKRRTVQELPCPFPSCPFSPFFVIRR